MFKEFWKYLTYKLTWKKLGYESENQGTIYPT